MRAARTRSRVRADQRELPETDRVPRRHRQAGARGAPRDREPGLRPAPRSRTADGRAVRGRRHARSDP